MFWSLYIALIFNTVANGIVEDSHGYNLRCGDEGGNYDNYEGDNYDYDNCDNYDNYDGYGLDDKRFLY